MITTFTPDHLKAYAPYYRLRLVAELRLVLPTAEAVAGALEAIDLAEFTTQLPQEEIAPPFLELVKAGAKIHPELLVSLLDTGRRHGMPWAQYVEELLLPCYVLAGVPLPGVPAHAGRLAPYRPHVHALALRVLDRNPCATSAMVYASLEARTHLEVVDSYNADVPRQTYAPWAALAERPNLELAYGVIPRRLLEGDQALALTDDFLETAKVA